MFFILNLYAFTLFQQLHEYMYDGTDISIHYNEIHTTPDTKVYFDPPIPIIYKMKLDMVDYLTSSSTGIVYIRIPILNDTMTHLQPIKVTINQTTTLVNLDKESHMQVYKSYKDSPVDSLEYKLATACHPKQLKSHFIEDVWKWITNLFKKAKESIVEAFRRCQIWFDFDNLKRVRLVSLHLTKLLQKYSVDVISKSSLQAMTNATPPLSNTTISTVDKPASGILLGTLLENQEFVKSSDKSVATFSNASVQLKAVLKNGTMSTLLDGFNSTTISTENVGLLLKKLTELLKKSTAKVYQVLTSLLKPIAFLYSHLQYAILQIPLFIPFLSHWLSSKLGNSLKLVDFYLLSTYIKINKAFHQFGLELTNQDVLDITSISSFRNLNTLNEKALFKIYYIDQLTWSNCFSVLPPFIGLRSVLSWLNPLWNGAGYITGIYSSPRNIFNTHYTKTEASLHIARIFDSFIHFIPDPFLFPISKIILTLIPFFLYGLPFSIYLGSQLLKLDQKEFPDDIKDKRLVKQSLGAFYTVTINIVIQSIVPFSFPVIIYALFSLTAFLDKLIFHLMEWKTVLR